jgi:hypothetical protein
VAYHWLPEEEFLFRMHRRIRKLIAAPTSDTRRYIEYRGAIEMGVNTRLTIRSALRGLPKVFVRTFPAQRSRRSTMHEPIVWILAESYLGQGNFSAGGIGRHTASKWPLDSRGSVDAFPIGTLDVYEPWEDTDFNLVYNTVTYNDDRTGQVLHAKRCGWINFGWDFDDEDSARKALGIAFDRRFPNHADYHDERDRGLMIGCVDPDSTIVVVAPTSFVLPAIVSEYARARKKSIAFHDIGMLSRADRQRFRTHYVYYSAGGKDSVAEKNFEILMRGFWE